MAGMSTRLGTYATWQLAQASTPRSVLADLVRRATHSDIDRVDRIVEGYSNEVYRVRCAEEQDVVVRILRFDDDTTSAASAGEAWAIGCARAVGVPAPEVLLLDTVRVEGAEFPAMVQRAVPGRPLGEVIDRLSERQRHDLLAELGGLMARINGIQIDEECDWPAAIAAELADRAANRDKIIAGGFSAPQLDRILDLLGEYVREMRSAPGVLCHGDLSPKHVFVTGGDRDSPTVRVSGIIDFGDWQSGLPVHDLAVLRVRDPRLDLLPVLAGYGTPADETYRRQLDLHTLIIALDSLAFGVAENDRSGIESTGRLIRTLTG
jgi:Ser/Thr protein kinase RdoA (MazF antagonist)